MVMRFAARDRVSVHSRVEHMVADKTTPVALDQGQQVTVPVVPPGLRIPGFPCITHALNSASVRVVSMCSNPNRVLHGMSPSWSSRMIPEKASPLRS